MIVFAALLLIVCMQFALYYLDGARDIKRLESNAKSPIFEVFGAALSGVNTIRAFQKTDTYTERMFGHINAHGSTLFYMWTLNRWLTFRLGVVGAIFAVVMALIIASIKNFDPPIAGFALSFALQYTDAIFWSLRQYATVEMAMNSTERIVEYSEIDIEDQGGIQPPAAWPAEGKVNVQNLVIGYAPDLPPVLRGISFDVKPQERCAVVGRTGAGKSSLTLALFRFLEAREGTISIDGIDISQLRLRDLRSRLAIIPQDPVLFSGTIRSNLDPFDEHEDYELVEALKRVHLISDSSELHSSSASLSDVQASSNADHNPVLAGNAATPSTHTAPSTPKNTNLFQNLYTPISESGQNLSQGQRQLLCLARAIISRPKILILDEATSAVDKATDELIQRSIREQFKDSTLIVIAHRLSTIADFDRVLVLGEGRVLEFDSPQALLEREIKEGEDEGAFRGLVERSGERDAVIEKIMGENARGSNAL
jgi:ABC-type multidrug transport system fused ATPase/permease subunit